MCANAALSRYPALWRASAPSDVPSSPSDVEATLPSLASHNLRPVARPLHWRDRPDFPGEVAA